MLSLYRRLIAARREHLDGSGVELLDTDDACGRAPPGRGRRRVQHRGRAGRRRRGRRPHRRSSRPTRRACSRAPWCRATARCGSPLDHPRRADRFAAMLLAGIITDVTDWLDEVSGQWWFLLVIFAIAFLDSVIPLVPSETAVIIGGVAAGLGEQNLLLVILSGALGAFCGDNIAYLIGRRFSPWINRRAERRPKTARRLEWASEQIRTRGGLLLITARFIPGGRTALTVSCGLTRQPHGWFARWVAVAAVIWATYAAGLGRDLRQPLQGRPHGRLPPRLRVRPVDHDHHRGRAPRRAAAAARPSRSTRPRPRCPEHRHAPHTLSAMLALIPVRDGVLPAGADETVAECGGRALLAGSGPDADELAGIAGDVRLVELGPFAPARWADALADLIVDDDDDVVVLPASPDGRDLAPRLAHRLGRPLLAGAIAVVRERRRGWFAAAGSNCTTSRSPGPWSPRCSRASEASLHPRVSTSSEGFLRPVGATLRDRKPSDGCDGGGGAAARRRDDRPRRGRPDLRRRGRAGRAGPVRPARRGRRPRRRGDGGDPGGHGSGLGRPRAADRHDRGDRRPRAVRRPRDQRRRPTHRRTRRPRPHRQREHRSALPDDADGRPRRGQRRQRRARRADRRLGG